MQGEKVRSTARNSTGRMAVASEGALQYLFVFCEITLHHLGQEPGVCFDLSGGVVVYLLLMQTAESEQAHAYGYENFLFDLLFYFNIQ